MAGLPANAFDRRLLALDHDALAALVADLWSASGWTVSRDGAVVSVSRDGATRRLLVLPPRRLAPGLRSVSPPDRRVDVVVTARRIDEGGRLPPGTPDVAVEDADDLRDRLRYALDEEACREVLARHLGVDRSVVREPDHPPTGASQIPGLGTADLRSPPPVEVPNRQQVSRSIGLVFGVVLVGIGVVALVAGIGGVTSSGGTGTVDAAEPAATGVYTSLESAVYDVDRTCEREPREVASVASAALRGPSLDRGLVVLGELWNPHHVQGVRAEEWNSMMVSEALRSYRRADRVEVGEASIDTGESARVEATAIENGDRSPYVYRLSYRTQRPYANCWVLDEFGPAGTPAHGETGSGP